MPHSQSIQRGIACASLPAQEAKGTGLIPLLKKNEPKESDLDKPGKSGAPSNISNEPRGQQEAEQQACLRSGEEGSVVDQAASELPTSPSHLGGLARQLSANQQTIRELKLRAFAKAAELRKEARTATYQPRQQHKPLRKQQQGQFPTPAAPAAAASSQPQPVLSERLCRKLEELGQLAAQAEAELAVTDSKEGLLARAMANGLVVGRANCAGNTIVEVYSDRLQYQFQHRQLGRLTMVMYYRDMVDVAASRRTRMLSFHISTPLRKFGSMYKYTDPRARLTLHFCDDLGFLEVWEQLRTAIPSKIKD